MSHFFFLFFKERNDELGTSSVLKHLFQFLGLNPIVVFIRLLARVTACFDIVVAVLVRQESHVGVSTISGVRSAKLVLLQAKLNARVTACFDIVVAVLVRLKSRVGVSSISGVRRVKLVLLQAKLNARVTACFEIVVAVLVRLESRVGVRHSSGCTCKAREPCRSQNHQWR